MSLGSYIKRFFSRVEEVKVMPPTEEELVDGRAFTIRHYPQRNPLHMSRNDTLIATITEGDETIARVSEPVGCSMTVDTISTLRFNDSLGYKHAVGVLFGQRKPNAVRRTEGRR